MREVALKLNELYGTENNRSLAEWLNKQSSRVGYFDGGAVSLVDVDEASLIASIKRLSVSVPLSAAQLIEHTAFLPAMNKSQTEFEGAIRFKAGYYAFLLTSSGNIEVNEFSLVREYDKFERYGHDRHVTHIPNKEKLNGPAVIAYLNGTVKDSGLQFSVALNKDELAGVREAQIENLFNGVDPYTKEEWEDVYLAAVMERLYDEDIFSCLEGAMGDNALGVYRAVKAFNADRYKEETTRSKLKVYSSYGKHIATKTFRFNAVEKLEQKRQSPKLTLIQNNSSETTKQDNEPYVDEEIMHDFGGF